MRLAAIPSHKSVGDKNVPMMKIVPEPNNLFPKQDKNILEIEIISEEIKIF